MPKLSNPFKAGGGSRGQANPPNRVDKFASQKDALAGSRRVVPAQPTAPAGTKNGIQTLVPDLTDVASASIKERRDLWEEAVNKLDQEQRKALRLQFDGEGKVYPPVTTVIQEVVDQVEAACEKHKANGLKITHRDGRVIADVRESAQKVIRCALRSKGIIDASVKFDPTGYSSSAWTVISLGLQLVQNDHDRLAAVFDASAVLADNLHRYANIEANYRDQEISDVGYLEDKLMSCYHAILEYSAKVQQERKRSFAGRVWYSFYSMSEQPLQKLQADMLTADNALGKWKGLIEQEYRLKESAAINKKIDEASSKLDQILEGFAVIKESKHLLESVLVTMATKEDIQQIYAFFQQRVAEGLAEPATSKPASESVQAHDAGTKQPVIDGDEDLDRLIQEVFIEFREFEEASEQYRKKIELLPEMRPHRARNNNMLRAEKIMTWVEATSSQLLWIDGNGVLGRYDFNSLFVGPLLIFGDSNFESVLILRHLCGDNMSIQTNNHRTLIQALIIQIIKQRPRAFRHKAASLTRDKTSDISALWSLFLECLQEIKADCVFIIIDGMDYLQDSQTNEGYSEKQIVLEKLEALVKDNGMLVKILLTAKLSHEPPAPTEDQMALIVTSHVPSREPRRTLSLAVMQDELLLIPQKLIEIQERRCQRLKFAHLPLLYTPNSMIYAFSNGYMQAFIVSSLSGMEQLIPDTYEPLRIRAWSIEHNGKHLTKRYHDFSISQFQGEKAVNSLRYIPSGYLQDESEARKMLIARGRKYCDLAMGFHYKQVLRNGESVRIVVDQEEVPGEFRYSWAFDDDFKISDSQKLKPRILMACPLDMFAYHLEEAKWRNIPVSDITDIQFEHDILETLILDRDQKLLALTLVQSHLHKMDKGNDHLGSPYTLTTNGSRRGLSILLHGAPGTGKTHTAMCTAETVKRPFLSDTIGAGPGNGHAVERELSALFELAQKWRAILVMENSDAFMASRSRNDDATPVTLVMRAMDMYDGVLFLTANRIGQFDEAIVTRLDLVLYYPPLKGEAQLLVWNGFVDKVMKESGGMEQREDIMEFVQNRVVTRSVDRGLLNGHQIRSIILAARQLAKHFDEPLGLKHIKVILTRWDNFTDHLSRSTAPGSHTLPTWDRGA